MLHYLNDTRVIDALIGVWLLWKMYGSIGWKGVGVVGVACLLAIVFLPVKQVMGIIFAVGGFYLVFKLLGMFAGGSSAPTAPAGYRKSFDEVIAPPTESAYAKEERFWRGYELHERSEGLRADIESGRVLRRGDW